MTAEVQDRVRPKEQAEEPTAEFAIPLDTILQPWDKLRSVSIDQVIGKLQSADTTELGMRDPESGLQQLYNAAVSDPRSFTPLDFAIRVVQTRANVVAGTRTEHNLLAGASEGDIRQFVDQAAELTAIQILTPEAVSSSKPHYDKKASGLGKDAASGLGSFRFPRPRVLGQAGQAALHVIGDLQGALRSKKPIEAVGATPVFAAPRILAKV